jgi:hypothetical protein
MICKETEKIIDTLLRLKDNTRTSTTINRIGSYEESKKTTQCVNIINEIMDNYKTQNKVASVQSNRTGELVAFQTLLKGLITY